MSRYNKAYGSGLGGIVGLLLGVLIIAGLNYAKIEITQDLQAQIDVAIPILTGWIMAIVGTYVAPKNSE